MSVSTQKTFTAYKVELNDSVGITSQIAAHIAGLSGGHQGDVERLEVYRDGNNTVGILVMSDYVPYDTALVFLGSAKTADLHTGTATVPFIAPYNGKIVTAFSRISADPGTGGTNMQLKVNGGTAATQAVIHASGAAANSLVTAQFADNNVVVAGDKVELVSTNVGTNSITAIVGLIMQKTA